MTSTEKLTPAAALAAKNTLRFPGESESYRRARDALLIKEIELRRAMEGVARQLRALPPGGPVPEAYVFDGVGEDGEPTKLMFSDLFAPGKDTLIAYSYMFPRHPEDDRPRAAHGPTAELDREDGPCPSCTAFIDQLDGAAEHLKAAGFNFVVIAKAPLKRVLAFAEDRGWRHVRLISSEHNHFKRDYHAEAPDGSQVPMMMVFHRGRDGIRHVWSSEMCNLEPDPGQDSRHNGTLEPLWNLMDLTPVGRPKDWREQLQYG
jgi:predicted dithiol-disulfide oxidoreductase (DUF899 family)